MLQYAQHDINILKFICFSHYSLAEKIISAARLFFWRLLFLSFLRCNLETTAAKSIK